MDDGESGTCWFWCEFGGPGRSSVKILSHVCIISPQWPYSYDSCDVGTLPNQTYPGEKKPLAATENGDPTENGVLVGRIFRYLLQFSKRDVQSFLQGQRLSACTCPGESHPGPVRQDGTYVGRSAPEIDIFEATVDYGIGKVRVLCMSSRV